MCECYVCVTGCPTLVVAVCLMVFFKQKTAYDMRTSDGSSGVCSSDLDGALACEQGNAALSLLCVGRTGWRQALASAANRGRRCRAVGHPGHHDLVGGP